MIPLSEPTLEGNESAYLAECVHSTMVSSVGPFVGRFEQAFADALGVEHAVACASGTAALHLALLEAGVTQGDEVLVSDLTFIASANPVLYCGASVTLVDSELETWNLDPAIVLEELEGRVARGASLPRAIVAVHVLGHPARLGELRARCEEWGIVLVEDAAEALGARWHDDEHGSRAVGTLGAFGCFSFNGNKLLTTGGGGMVVTADAAAAQRVRHLSTQAKLPGAAYRHDRVGFNYRLGSLAAAVGVAQLERIEVLLGARRMIADRYDDAFNSVDEITPPPNAGWGERTGWMYSILLPDQHGRDVVMDHLAAGEVQARPIWVPLHEQQPYRDARLLGSGVASDLAARALSIPCSAHLARSDQERVIELVLAAVAGAGFNEVGPAAQSRGSQPAG